MIVMWLSAFHDDGSQGGGKGSSSRKSTDRDGMTVPSQIANMAPMGKGSPAATRDQPQAQKRQNKAKTHNRNLRRRD